MPLRRPARPTSVLLTALAALLVASLLAGCSSTPSTGDKGYVDGSGGLTVLDPGGRTPPPGTVSGETLEGEQVSLDDYRGQVVVLNVWGSWCPPCRKEAPLLADAARELARDDVVFLGINTRDSSQAQGLAYQRRFDVPYPSIYDPSGRNLLKLRGTLTPNSIPSTVVIDQQGRVAARLLGDVESRSTLVGIVEDVRDGSAGESS
ncbi:Thiol-disulfide isomerase or thioredoxin [Nocardioides scoriae]|uniref:Thiol-disulfide isomerase or thioredoxin n=1 Tax=Nocardioides scoriae TaxID=642780 RepID=A0A1H1TSM0_9ACTN|nr:TlpA disulfide reductase family protein [Nocardioides scoriae]SDS63197.1 Thiol-disulfide isomerase or thioredoxin [Nocardioides scoriae]